MNSDDAIRSKVEVTAADVARLVNVTPAAVKNWRNRHDDFPKPVGRNVAGGDLFNLSDVERWLLRRGEGYRRLSPDEVVWQALDSARGLGHEVDGVIDFACSFLTITELRGDADCWLKALRNASPESIVAELHHAATFDPDLLRPLVSVPPALAEAIVRPLTLLARSKRAEVFEKLLARRGRWAGLRLAEHASGPSVTRLLVALASPSGTIFDPAAGEGGFLLEAAKWAAERQEQVTLVGRDISERAHRVARQRFLVHWISADFQIDDPLRSDSTAELRADVVLCDPPYGAKIDRNAIGSDARWFAGLPTGTTDFAWLQLAAFHLNANGRAYVLCPTGTLFRGGRDAAIRTELIRRGCVEAVVALPARTSLSAKIPIALWVLRSPNAGAIGQPVLLIDATEEEPEGRTDTPLTDALSARVVATVERFRANPHEFAADTRSIAVDPMQLLSPDASLLPASWVHERSPEELYQAVKRLTAELHKLREATSLDQQPELELQLAVSSGPPRLASLKELEDIGTIELFRGAAIPKDADVKDGGAPVLRSPRSTHRDEPPRRVDLSQLRKGTRVTQAGDVIIFTLGKRPYAFVENEGGHVLPDFMHGVRILVPGLDPIVFAALISSPHNAQFVADATIPRVRAADLEVPQISAPESARVRTALVALDAQAARAHEIEQTAHKLRAAVVEAISAGVLPTAAGTDLP